MSDLSPKAADTPPRPTPGVATLAAYALADPLPEGAVSLAQNESCCPASPAALAAAAAALAGTALYPDPDWAALREAIAVAHGIAPGDILCGAGSMELIGALVRAFAGPGDEVLGTEFGYLFVRSAAAQAGARFVAAPETRYAIDPEAVLAAVTPATRIVFLCNPGNPTGTRLPNATLLALHERLPPTVLLVIDQAYGEFDEQDHDPLFARVAEVRNLCVLRSFSKAYGLAGARVGWGLFPPAVAQEVRKLLNPNNIPVASQAAAAAAMADRAHMRATVAVTAARRDAFVAALEADGLSPVASATNFVLVPFADSATAARVDAALRAAGIHVRPMGGYGLGHCLRVTVGAPDAMARTAEIMARARG
ncbi:histidinol-phosphate transaminase [Frigidibacter sp. MR17.14]|uniref:pyridoxal phosphate-dependent aminotransferase n=1 Tax=Frigidibacter sp. MR17.14 TaxID=3126509 RepID=UPI003012FB02